jgi:PilZ domain
MSDLQNRRSERVMLRLDLLVRLEMGEGSGPQTHAFTVNVNAHGGLLESPFRMTVGQRITLINPQTGKEVSCKVVEVGALSEGYFKTAFEFEQRNPQFWAIAFPPRDWGLTKKPAEGNG